MFGRFPCLKIPWSYYADAYTNRKACFSQQRDQPGVDGNPVFALTYYRREELGARSVFAFIDRAINHF
jgi:hypothetical protein